MCVWYVQAEAEAQAGNTSEAERLFLMAKQPELALQMYRKMQMWEDALRIAEEYAPAKASLPRYDLPGSNASPT